MPAVGVYGPSGWGKTTAIRPPEGPHLDEKKTFLIIPDKKPLPFRGWKTLYPKKYEGTTFKASTSHRYDDAGATNPGIVLKLMKALEDREEIENGVIDTVSHILTHQFITRGKEKGYEKFTEFAMQIYDIINFARESRINWFLNFHNETAYDATGSKVDKVRTIGKLLDEKIDIPSMFTIMLVPEVHRNDKGEAEYFFITQSDGTNYAKSPSGMFPYHIPNNYQIVLDYIKRYEEEPVEVNN